MEFLLQQRMCNHAENKKTSLVKSESMTQNTCYSFRYDHMTMLQLMFIVVRILKGATHDNNYSVSFETPLQIEIAENALSFFSDQKCGLRKCSYLSIWWKLDQNNEV